MDLEHPMVSQIRRTGYPYNEKALTAMSASNKNTHLNYNKVWGDGQVNLFDAVDKHMQMHDNFMKIMREEYGVIGVHNEEGFRTIQFYDVQDFLNVSRSQKIRAKKQDEYARVYFNIAEVEYCVLLDKREIREFRKGLYRE